VFRVLKKRSISSDDFFQNFSDFQIHVSTQACENPFYGSIFVQLRTHDLLAEHAVVIFTALHTLSFNYNMTRIAVEIISYSKLSRIVESSVIETIFFVILNV
jgi:hypothetical protein